METSTRYFLLFSVGIIINHTILALLLLRFIDSED
jgi:hypothetical protein